ncbi:uncharacterized protein LOC127705183 isoform X11 [Mytilus californianus]|uniref:uncharacterized protein LOC127705183 isoform X11 n=1 Tax=Mytilus californianus TaxID=6549 RepID=UPI002247581D|nr:uncharacterized protein LOC127705183 isoform X11 [Mytilus californianus]
MNQYQKVYMNQIHSSSLLGQLAQMWKSQMLCDALIRTGNVTTKAHRVVLVAACPMLQSMDNASVGSHLEVRLAADIKQEAVNSFLQYLYEGFMMLSEENCKDVEKVARLLQVDSVTKCCIDFYNCLQKKTGVPVYSNTQYKYSSADLLEFRHVRTTDLQKTLHERMMKRAAADSVRPTSPSGKRQRMQQQRPPSPNIDLAMFGQKADDTLSMAHSYMGNIGNQAAAEPWERVPRIGAIHSQRQSHPKPGVIEIVEDSLEILQTQPPDKDGNKSAPPIIQKSLAISVSSQVNSSTDVHVVNVNDSSSHPTAAGDGPIMSTGRDSITVSPLTVMPGTSSLSSSSTSSPLTKDPHKSAMDKDMSDKQPYAKKLQSSLDHQSSTPQRGLFPVSISPANMSPINQVKKSFAAGSASQAASMSQSHDSPAKRTPTSAVNEMERPPSSDSGKDLGTKSKVDDRSALNSTDMAPDLSIVKVEPTGEAGLDMYVDVPEESMIQAQQREQREHDDESDLELEEASGDWSRDEMSNEAAGGDQNNSWYIGQFKGYQGKDRASFGHELTQELHDSISTEFEKNSHGYKHNVVDQPVEWSVQKSQNLPYLMGTSVLECQDVSESLPFIVTDDNLASEQGGKYDGKPKFHCLVYNADTKAKYCVYCKIMGNRTSCGWNVRSYYCCDACDVPLCSGKRDCYNDYHKMLKKAQPDLTWLCSDLRPVKK